jgi:hypothetical protein
VSTFFNALKERQKIIRRMKYEFEPLSRKKITGETILKSFVRCEQAGSIIIKVIKKCVGNTLDSNWDDSLLISLPRFCSLIRVHKGYLSQSENIILAVNFLYHLEDFSKDIDFKREFEKFPSIKRRSKDNEIDYLEFLNYFLAVIQLVEYYIPIDVSYYKRLSRHFSKDKDLKKFCDIVNILLDAIDKGDSLINAEELSQLIAA